MMPAGFYTHWYLHLPSLILSALIYLLIGRLVLAQFFGEHNGVMRVLGAVTNPVIKTVAAITPRVVPPAVVVVFAVVWLLAARIILHQAILAAGMRRSFG